MSDVDWKTILLFAKIGDKKISGSQSFSCFLDNGLNNVITHSFLYLAVQPCFAIVG